MIDNYRCSATHCTYETRSALWAVLPSFILKREPISIQFVYIWPKPRSPTINFSPDADAFHYRTKVTSVFLFHPLIRLMFAE
ncbi:hypothetical protein Hypma_001086 [Hypsizygus marmoreus]|uniref:Uncharacterized protein n=1 Tax=Hypsizygus marmoreus TaxID=39966 RepID=A0A369JAI6_HYPMA|nr:hypothetical protein Hypma_001086 [Hypsizygus marmoreus]